MHTLDQAIASLVDTAKALEKTAVLAEETKKGLTLLNKSTLKKMKLTPADIECIPEVWLKGREHPVYQAADVQEYIDSRKASPKKRLRAV